VSKIQDRRPAERQRASDKKKFAAPISLLRGFRLFGGPAPEARYQAAGCFSDIALQEHWRDLAFPES